MKRSIGIILGIILAACIGEYPEHTLTFLFIAFLVWPFLAAFCKLLGKAAKRRPRQPEYATRKPEPVLPAPVPLTVEERIERIGRAYAERRRTHRIVRPASRREETRVARGREDLHVGNR